MAQGNNYYPGTNTSGVPTYPVTYNDFYASGTDESLLIRDVDTEIRLSGYKNRWLQAIVSKGGKTRRVKNRKFEWLKDTVPNGEFTVASGGLGSGTSSPKLYLTDPKYIIPNMVLYNPVRDDRVIIVQKDTATDTSTTAISVVRESTITGDSGSTDPAWLEGDVVFSLGTSFGEKSTIPGGVVKSPVLDYNYTQRFLYAIRMTNDMLRSDSYFKNPRAYWHKMEMEKHLLAEEKLAIFGKRSVTPWGGNSANGDAGYHLFTGGLLEFITTNVIDLSGAALTENTFRDQLDQVFDEGSEEKTMLCSRAAAEHISRWMTDSSKNYRIQVEGNKIGFKCNQYEGGSGRINILPTDILKNATTASGAFTGDLMIILETDQITRVVNEPTKVKMSAQNPETISEVIDYYDGQYGWEWGVEKCHSIIKNWVAS